MPSGTPFVRSARLFAKDASVAQLAIVEVINADVLLGRVVYVKLCAVGGKGESVGIFKIFGKQLKLAIGSNSVDSLKGYFLLLIQRADQRLDR